MAMQSALQGLLGGAGGGPGAPPPAASLGTGPPPQLPGVPPAATGVGAMPVGSPGTDKRGAINTAILDLSDVIGHAPSLAPQINALIDQLKAQLQSKGPGPDVDKPGIPGSAGSPTSPVMESGSPGSM